MINEQALQRVKEAKLTGETLARTFEQVAQQLVISGGQQTHLNLDYQSSADEVKPGEMIPYLVIGLRPA